MVTLATRSSLIGTVDIKLRHQIQKEEQYWGKILKRILATVKLLSKQGLTFRGSDENLENRYRGNYLSCLVYLAEFDDFLAEHLRRYGNQGKGSTSYLSHHICDEFILLMKDKLLDTFTAEIKTAKYFLIIIDSTPDISHCDQLTFVIRYVHKGQIVERFMGFLKIERHTAEYLQEIVLNNLKQLGLDIKNCRGQSYDNAANMTGKFNGLQAKIRTLSPTAVYILCTNHSLNLVLNFACETCFQAVDYFNLVQNIYTFFSSLTHRWQKFKKNCSSVPKRLNDTRWSARHDAVHALNKNYKFIQNILTNLAQDEHEKPLTRSEALSLSKKMETFKTMFLTIIWSKLLERVNATSKILERPTLNLISAVQLLESLVINESLLMSLEKNSMSCNVRPS